jgi:predicted small metal-binding protein/ketosteroid isomerase-like protein
MKTLHCRDAGFDCAGVIEAATEEDILSQAAEHAQAAHNVRVTPELAAQLKALIKDGKPMSVAENKNLITRYFAAISGKAKSAAAIAEFTDSPELEQHIEIFEAAFPRYELLADEMIAEGDKVAVCARFRGEHKGDLMGIGPTGKQVAIPFIIVYQVADRKIAGFNLAIDQMDLMKQLGVIQ